MTNSFFSFQLTVPDAAYLQQNYTENPYWGKVWHSAIAMGEFIIENATIFKNKKVLELAAGLGLPSLVVSQYADAVICSDVSYKAVEYINNNISINQVANIKAMQMDWNKIPESIEYDIVLLSDVNYDPSMFADLQKLIVGLLSNNKQIILATPQRLMAKEFIEWVLEHKHQIFEKSISLQGENKYITILFLT